VYKTNKSNPNSLIKNDFSLILLIDNQIVRSLTICNY